MPGFRSSSSAGWTRLRVQVVNDPRYDRSPSLGISNRCKMVDNPKETLGNLYDQGLAVRREVLGAAYVDNSVKSANDFMMSFQHIVTEWCWGYAWTRDGLDRKTRSMINLAML